MLVNNFAYSRARNLDLRSGRNTDLVYAPAVALWCGDRLDWDDDIRDHYAAVDWDEAGY